MALAKSAGWVRLVVPTSSSRAPALRITSGMRKAPPISTSSPRDTTTSRRLARLLSSSRTAAALLLTTVAASAPVSSQINACTRASRSPRRPRLMSNSRSTGAVIARVTACTAASGSNARPRLVCSTVPVRLNIGCRSSRASAASAASTVATSAGPSTASCSCVAESWPALIRSRSACRCERSSWVIRLRPWPSISAAKAGRRSNRSSEGRAETDAGVGSVAVIASLAVGLPQQRILAGARITFLAQQQVQRQRAEVIGDRFQ